MSCASEAQGLMLRTRETRVCQYRAFWVSVWIYLSSRAFQRTKLITNIHISIMNSSCEAQGLGWSIGETDWYPINPINPIKFWLWVDSNQPKTHDVDTLSFREFSTSDLERRKRRSHYSYECLCGVSRAQTHENSYSARQFWVWVDSNPNPKHGL